MTSQRVRNRFREHTLKACDPIVRRPGMPGWIGVSCVDPDCDYKGWFPEEEVTSE